MTNSPISLTGAVTAVVGVEPISDTSAPCVFHRPCQKSLITSSPPPITPFLWFLLLKGPPVEFSNSSRYKNTPVCHLTPFLCGTHMSLDPTTSAGVHLYGSAVVVTQSPTHPAPGPISVTLVLLCRLGCVYSSGFRCSVWVLSWILGVPAYPLRLLSPGVK